MSFVLAEVDLLYEGCVTDPQRWDVSALQDWAEGVAASDELDREAAKYLRRVVRAATKLAAFWATTSSVGAPDEWQSRVDMALGARAWRPVLELAELLLDQTGAESAFVRVSELFPVVNNQPFMDGIDYETWMREDRQFD